MKIIKDEIGYEKELKFLPRGGDWRVAARQAERRVLIEQGYVLIDPQHGVSRVRINRTPEGQFLKAGIEIKLHPTDRGAPELPVASLNEVMAQQYLEFARNRVVKKLRHYIRIGGLLFEIDEFIGRHAPLVVIELEHNDPSSITRAMLPDWVGEEVTGDPQYSNAIIAQR